MQFMNSSLNELVSNLTEDDLKYLTEDFGLKNSELLKQIDVYPYEYKDNFIRFGKEKLPHRVT